MLLDQLLSRVAQQLVFQHLDHRLSPARRGDEKTLEEFIAFLRWQKVVELWRSSNRSVPFGFMPVDQLRQLPAFLRSRLAARVAQRDKDQRH